MSKRERSSASLCRCGLWLVLAAGCAQPGAPPESPQAPVASAPAASAPPAGAASPDEPSPSVPTPSAPALASCGAVGPAACSLAPLDRPALCGSLASCVKKIPDLDLDGLAVECARPDGVERGSPWREQPAPEGSGVQATALADSYAYDDMSANFGASYLAVRFDAGWCWADDILQWEIHRSYFDTDITSRWEPQASGFHFSVQAHRVAHESLDQEELSSGQSDVTAEICNEITYEVKAGQFRRVAERSTQGPCPTAPLSRADAAGGSHR